MTVIHDTYRAKTLAEARAAAMQAIETMHEDGFSFVRIQATRDAGDVVIHVDYQKDADA